MTAAPGEFTLTLIADGSGIEDADGVTLSADAMETWINETIYRSTLFLPENIVGSTGDGPRSVFAADIDGDGDIDFAAAFIVDDKIAWYENTVGDGSVFVERIISTTADGAVSVIAADVDGDGDNDLLSASVFGDTIAWYENTAGDGSAFVEHSISTTFNRAFSVFAADVDGDGDTDVVSASNGDDKISWFENTNGDGSTFVERIVGTNAVEVESVFAIDVDADGDLDLLSASKADDKVAWYENTSGNGSDFVEHTVSTNADGARSVFGADIDGDGDTDVISASAFDDKIAWYENTSGDGSSFAEHVVSTTIDQPSSVYAVDIDADGDMDLLSTSPGDDTVVLFENSNGSGSAFIEHIISSTADIAIWVIAEDVDGDGDVDVVSTSGADDKLAWYENRGGQFALETSNTAPRAISDGDRDDVLKITAHHRGRTGDADIELASLELKFEASGFGRPRIMNTAQANALIENVHIYHDDGDGVFDADQDTLVTSVGDLELTAGKFSFELPDGHANLQVSQGSPQSWFVVPELTSNASRQKVNRFRVTHVTENSSTGENAENDSRLALEFAKNTVSSIVTPELGPLTAEIEELTDPLDGPAPPLMVTFSYAIGGLRSHDFSLTRNGTGGQLGRPHRQDPRFAAANHRHRVPARPGRADGAARRVRTDTHRRRQRSHGGRDRNVDERDDTPQRDVCA